MRYWKSCVGIMLALLVCACDTLTYYGQAVGGHVALLTHRQLIEKLLEDPATAPALHTKLATISQIRRFALQELNLPVGKHYSQYVPLDRSYVVWNVFATPEFSMDPQTWCFPVAGCVSYRGYYSEKGARKFAERQKNSGDDVYVGGVAAYSTLGWFADPVLNTIINRDEHRLAALIFHELAHQRVYIPGDTIFNESFATAVELEGLKRWLEQAGSDDAADILFDQANREQRYRREFVTLVQGVIPPLETLYSSHLSPEAMRAEKAALFEKLRQDYRQLKQGWQGYSAYDGWFEGDINNAKLNTVATYFNKVPAFEALLAETAFQLPDFYDRVDALARLGGEEREQALARLTP